MTYQNLKSHWNTLFKKILVLDLRYKSMNNNLVLYGVTDAPKGEQESCETIVCNIIRTNLEIEEEIQLERAHRLGRKHDQRPRPIVAKFNRYPQRELVRKTASKLKGTSISLGEQFPKEIQERRKQLLPILRREKERGKRVALVKDKLYIDGRPYHQVTDTYTDTRSESEAMQGGSRGDVSAKVATGRGRANRGTTGKVGRGGARR